MKHERCPDCGSSLISIDGKEWHCEDQRSCGFIYFGKGGD